MINASVHDMNEDVYTSGTLFAEVLHGVKESPSETEFNFKDLVDNSDTNSDDADICNYLMSKNEKEDVGPNADDSSLQTKYFTENSRTNTLPKNSIVLDTGALLKAAREAENPNSQQKTYKRGQCPSKSALFAKRNRELKKQQFALLESQVQSLSKEKLELKKELLDKCQCVQQLQKENLYLRNVIANQSSLSAILNCIQNIPSFNFQTNNNIAGSLNDSRIGSMKPDTQSKFTLPRSCRKREPTTYVRAEGTAKKIKLDKKDVSLQVDQETPPVSPEPAEISGGICLHVSKNKASLEFCVSCAESATENWKRSGDVDHSYVKATTP